MTGTLSTQETSQTPWEPDTSLLDAARRDRSGRPGAQRGSRAGATPVVARKVSDIAREKWRARLVYL